MWVKGGTIREITSVVKRSLGIIIFAVVLPVFVMAQRRTPLSVEDALGALEFGQFTPVVFSPDGKWVVYTVRGKRKNSAPYKPEMYYATGVLSVDLDIYITNTFSGESRNLTGGKGSNFSPAWSPDGNYLGFISDRDGSGEAKLWVWDKATDTLRKVSDIALRSQEITWLPSGKGVVTTILPENLAGKDYAEQVSHPTSPVRDEDTIRIQNSTVLLYRASGGHGTKEDDQGSVAWSLQGYLRDIALVSLRTGHVEVLVRGRRIAKYVFSPDGSYVAFTSPERFEKPGSQQILWDLCVVQMSTRRVSVVASAVRFSYDGASFSWSPDSSRLAYLITGALENAGNCFIAEVTGGVPEDITGFERNERNHTERRPPLWSADGKSLYFVRDDSMWTAFLNRSKPINLTDTLGQRVEELAAQRPNTLWSPDGGRTTILLTYDKKKKESGFLRVDLQSGQSNRLLAESGSCFTCVNTDEHIYGAPSRSIFAYFAQDAQHGDDLFIEDLSAGKPRRLTHLNPQLETYKMGAARLVDWLSDDGQPLQGALLLPAGYQEGVRYPLIVWIYGGSRGSDSVRRFGLSYGGPFNMQLLATRGYAILFPDAPQYLGNPMRDLVKAVLPGVNKLIELGIADPDRLGIMGHSYGGYSTLSLIAQTKRFKAAVVEDGIADLISAYGQMSDDGSAFLTTVLEGGQYLMGGTPWEFRDRYIENSPIFFLEQVETPLLIVHGGEDKVVASFLGDELFVGLRRLGKEVEYAKYAGEGHSPLYWSFANQMDSIERVLAWFNGHVMNDTHH